MNHSFNWGRFWLISIPFIWLLVFFLLPFIIVVKMSLSDMANAMPPYVPTLDLTQGWSSLMEYLKQLDFENYSFLMDDELYVLSYLSSLKIALISTFLTLLVGYPLAYGMAKMPEKWRPILLMMVILPFWTSFLIRVYSWIGILKGDGLLNSTLMALGLINEPLVIMNTTTAVYIGIVYSYLPFLVLPLYATLEKIDHSLLEAAADLGASPMKAFWQITFPMSLPGVVAGAFLVFIPAMGEFVIPDLLGGSETLMIGKTLWEEFFGNRDWPLASAVAVALLLLLVIPILFFQRMQEKQQEANS
ncbi:ABC transporter permease subunit [Thiolinea disciformis]|uniref:ABC transporter permease subunit n=1 Tax=Thiolinea disciformis TaxID=125614 RepID=UPI0003775E3A|nr:ABC transporter permease subunit [Thiolinea disciformis]